MLKRKYDLPFPPKQLIAFFLQYNQNCIIYAILSILHYLCNMIILMADIVSSSKAKTGRLMSDFKAVVAQVNKAHAKNITSPLTITLGDEFQGVVKSVEAAMAIVFDLDHRIMRLKSPFSLRYVINQGFIDTPINTKIAYGMLGPGLTEAREALADMKTSRARFRVSLDDSLLSEKLTLALRVYQGITEGWTAAQKKVVSVFWEEQSDYRKVAKRLKKDPTVMWRRKRSLLIEEIESLRSLIFITINPKWQPQ